MSTVSRRAILVGMLISPSSSTRLCLPNATLKAPAADLVSQAAEEWAVGSEKLTAMQLEWQSCESVVFDKARRMKIGCARACRSNWPEARAMRALDQQIAAAYAHLAASAGRIRQMRNTTISGALAKIQLGLQVQGPYDWREHAFELVEDGLDDLRRLTGLA